MARYKVYCAEMGCKWNRDGHCAADRVFLSAGIVSTVHQGRLQYWKCKAYEESEAAKEARKIVERVLKHE